MGEGGKAGGISIVPPPKTGTSCATPLRDGARRVGEPYQRKSADPRLTHSKYAGVSRKSAAPEGGLEASEKAPAQVQQPEQAEGEIGGGDGERV